MQLRIEKIDYEGNGVCHNNGKVLFVKGSLKDELVEAHLVKEGKRFSIYETDQVLKKSPLRKEATCPFFKSCGGCVFDIVSYSDSLALKKEMVEDLFRQQGIGNFDLEILSSPKHYGYRNKISLKVQNGKFGYFKEDTHEFVPITNCLLAKVSIQNLLKDFSLLNIREGSITIRANENDELLLDIKTDELPRINENILLHHKIAGIRFNEKGVYNFPFFIERIDHLLYKVHVESFFQVNIDIAEKIALDIKKELSKEDIFYDLYCGVGYFSLKIASIVQQVVGIELNQKAILNAIYNASLNHITNVSFHAGKVEDVLEKIPIEANKAIVDPPRSGLHKNVRRVLKEKKFEKLIYISCNPKTLARDLQDLLEVYEIIYIKLYDMFPFTKHVEVLTVLKLK